MIRIWGSTPWGYWPIAAEVGPDDPRGFPTTFRVSVTTSSADPSRSIVRADGIEPGRVSVDVAVFDPNRTEAWGY